MQRDRGTQVVSYNPKEKRFTKVKVYLGLAATSYIPKRTKEQNENRENMDELEHEMSSCNFVT
ncbi:hypothetical protein H5410_025198 [Solanum commersonii]|uniref:Uncharacterized protein n=1 Tax=Solanum commersonii TaxID=4109 RepID=A0A9J5YTL0_SOLCO|nr:hypothetical protein H5410_025198 [Solanum commersonii]